MYCHNMQYTNYNNRYLRKRNIVAVSHHNTPPRIRYNSLPHRDRLLVSPPIRFDFFFYTSSTRTIIIVKLPTRYNRSPKRSPADDAFDCFIIL